MSDKIIDFYSGFEGETEIRLYGNYVLSIWSGYFDPIMEVLLKIENRYKEDGSAFGIVAEWTTLTGWCSWDAKKEKIRNLEEEIYAFSQFDLKELEGEEYNYISKKWKQTIKEVSAAIVKLLKEAKENNTEVYIEEC